MAVVEADSTIRFEMPDEPNYEIGSLGEGIELKSRRTVEFTTDFAEKWLEMPEFIGDRGTDENWVAYLARQMESGTFRWEQVNIMSGDWDGKTFRINGRHTAWARLVMDQAKFKEHGGRSAVQWLKYSCKTEQDLRQLYASTDRGKPRTRAVIVSAYLHGSEAFPDFAKSLQRRLASGLTWWLWEDSYSRALHSPDEVAFLLLKDYQKVAFTVGAFMGSWNSKETKHMMRQPVWAAMFATFNKSASAAKDFWQPVQDGIGLTDKLDPRYWLRRYLLNYNLGGAGSEIISPEVMYRACLMCWNAFRTNKWQKNYRPSQLEARPEVK